MIIKVDDVSLHCRWRSLALETYSFDWLQTRSNRFGRDGRAVRRDDKMQIHLNICTLPGCRRVVFTVPFLVVLCRRVSDLSLIGQTRP